LRFTPSAWAKLTWLCLKEPVEIGGFGVTDPADPLCVVEFVTVKQQADWASIRFEDSAVADYFDQQVDRGRRPEQFARIWIHCHPGDSPLPSGTDEETFARVFGHCQWAVMAILARTGKTYARLRFNVGPGGQILIPTEVDYRRPFPASDHAAWAAEFGANIQPFPRTPVSPIRVGGSFDDSGFDLGLPTSGPGRLEQSLTEEDELDAWADLLLGEDAYDLDAAAAKVAARWGMADTIDWTEAALALPLDRQREFRLEVENQLAWQCGS